MTDLKKWKAEDYIEYIKQNEHWIKDVLFVVHDAQDSHMTASLGVSGKSRFAIEIKKRLQRLLKIMPMRLTFGALCNMNSTSSGLSLKNT